MERIKLYITQDDEFMELDLYDNENITVVDSIQKVQDISKIFSPFTRDFKVPASANNNEIFKHYYDFTITNGFDGRSKVKALIQIGGVDYKKGFIRLISSDTKDGIASSYKLSFIGETTTLKDRLKDAKIKDLDFSNLVFQRDANGLELDELRAEAIRNGLYANAEAGTVGEPKQDDEGYDLYPDVIFAPIFDSGKVVAVPYVSANTSTPNTSNLESLMLTHFTGLGTHNVIERNGDEDNFIYNPVTPGTYKPSVKMGTLLSMINEQYGLNMQNDFLHREEIDQMYMWFNGKPSEGEIKDGDKAFNAANSDIKASVNFVGNREVVYTTKIGEPNKVTIVDENGQQWAQPLTNTISGRRYGFEPYKRYKFVLTPDNPLGIKVNYRIRQYYIDNNGNDVTLCSTTFNDPGEDTMEVSFQNAEITNIEVDKHYYANNMVGKTIYFDVIITSNEEISGKVSYTGFTRRYWTSSYIAGFKGRRYVYHNTSDSQPWKMDMQSFSPQLLPHIDIKTYAPEMKLLDLLKGIFKMFNMTAYIKDNQMIIETLETFYNRGTEYDITEFIDLKGSTVSRGFDFNDMKMTFEEAKDILSSNYAKTTIDGTGFGDLKKTREFLSLDGTEEEVDTEDETLSIAKGGKDYEIKLPFARMMFERLALNFKDDATPTQDGSFGTDEDGMLTDFVIGNAIDGKLEGVDLKPVIFYGKKCEGGLSFYSGTSDPELIDNLPGRVYASHTEHGNNLGKADHKLILVERDPGSSNTTDPTQLINQTVFASDVTSESDKKRWWNPSSIMASRYRRNGELMNSDGKFQSINFDNGLMDEFEYPNGFDSRQWINGLYDTYYKDYLKELYSKRSRLSKYTVNFPQWLLSTYKLNDTLIIGQNRYTINNINLNLVTGKGKVELLNQRERLVDPPVLHNPSLKFEGINATGDEATFSLLNIEKKTLNIEAVKLVSGRENNYEEYIIPVTQNQVVLQQTGSHPGKYMIENFVTTGWIEQSGIFDFQTATAFAIDAGGGISNESNAVLFSNFADNADPTIDSVVAVNISSNNTMYNVQASDDGAIRGIYVKTGTTAGSEDTTGTLVATYTPWSSGIVVVGAIPIGTTTNVSFQVFDYVYKTSAWYTTSVTIGTDTQGPSRPLISGANTTSGVDITVGNLVDNDQMHSYEMYKRLPNTTTWTLIATVLEADFDTSSSDVFSHVMGASDSADFRVRSKDVSGNYSGYSNTYTRTPEIGGGID